MSKLNIGQIHTLSLSTHQLLKLLKMPFFRYYMVSSRSVNAPLPVVVDERLLVPPQSVLNDAV